MRSSTTSKPAAAALSLLLVSLVLVACGGSSSSSTSKTATTATAGAAITPAQITARLATLRACLTEAGITPPKPVPGQPLALGGAVGLGAQLPKGVTRAQYEAALRKCALTRAGTSSGRGHLAGPVYRKALTQFAACMRQHGENIPAPNTTGKGPVFSTSGLNTQSPQFKAATVKCSGILRSAFGRPVGE
jgi:hypothetical protein